MGLDFSHSAAHWGYGGFMRFRARLAKQINIDIHTMEGFVEVGGIPWSTVDDRVVPLLSHSDCDGELSPKECLDIFPRLLELVKDWPEDSGDKQNAILLAEGMRDCSLSGEPLEFC